MKDFFEKSFIYQFYSIRQRLKIPFYYYIKKIERLHFYRYRIKIDFQAYRQLLFQF